jgi:hypothetical protein
MPHPCKRDGCKTIRLLCAVVLERVTCALDPCGFGIMLNPRRKGCMAVPAGRSVTGITEHSFSGYARPLGSALILRFRDKELF